MPIYEYRCAACGFQKEYLQKMSAAPLTECPECGKPSFRKMVTAAGFHLKGSGWYATDFKHGAKPKSKPEDTPAVKSDEQPAAKSEQQPAAKSEQQPVAKSDGKPAQQTEPAQEASAKKSDEPASAKTSGASPVSN
jgi:putative FmdB family regulatory protein